jgi:hypothetical protein
MLLTFILAVLVTVLVAASIAAMTTQALACPSSDPVDEEPLNEWVL